MFCTMAEIAYKVLDAEGNNIGTLLYGEPNLPADGVWRFDAIGGVEGPYELIVAKCY